MSGHRLPVRPRRVHITYSGTDVTCGGSIIMAITARNSRFEPRNWIRANA